MRLCHPAIRTAGWPYVESSNLLYMARRRFFVDSVRNEMAEVTGEDAHHLARVLRAEPGQVFEISDNQTVYLAEVESVSARCVGFRVKQVLAETASGAEIRLVAALIKFDRFEWMVEKATELGVSAIAPVETARSEKGLLQAAEKRVERWRKIARESSQQSRRARMPEILAPRKLHLEGTGLYLDEEGGAPLARLAAVPAVQFAVGPEGGWTGDERSRFLTSGWQPVSLGPGILRAETAAIAALAVISHLQWTATKL